MADDVVLRDLVAYEEIRRLAADYAHGVDKRDRERFGSVWHEDAAWQPMPDGDWSKGREAILSTLDGIWGSVAETHHWTANHSIRVNGDSATGLADADCIMKTPDGAWFRVAASYEDAYERRDDRWGIVSRVTVIHHQLGIAEP